MSALEDAHTAPPVTGLEPQAGAPRRRHRKLVWPALAAVLGAAGVAAWLWAADASTGSTPATSPSVATATVERGTISATESWDGTLEYGAPFTVAVGGEGTITRLVDQATTLKRGDELFRVNEQPVILLNGTVPMYRDLGPGASGVDVKQLEANLAKLGYKGFTADDEYTASTTEAVREWQNDIGAATSGTVSRAQVVFLSAGRRVESVHVDVGDPVGPGTPVLDVTSKDQIVSLDADVDDRDLFGVDTEVTIVLPSGREIPGTVSGTAVVAVPSESGGSPEGATTEPESIIEVDISVDKKISDDLNGAPVDVVVAIDERKNVLIVPVNALLALAEGGYGLEIVNDDGTTSIVPVDTGLFGDGKVEVEGEGIAEGTVVGVAGR